MPAIETRPGVPVRINPFQFDDIQSVRASINSEKGYEGAKSLVNQGKYGPDVGVALKGGGGTTCELIGLLRIGRVGEIVDELRRTDPAIATTILHMAARRAKE